METVLIKEDFEYWDEDLKHLFLKYLYKNLQDSVKGEYRARGHYVDEEHFVDIAEMSLSLPEGFTVPVKFTANWIKGNLLDLVVSADLNTTDWTVLIAFLNKIISKSHAMFKVDKQEKYFFRLCFGYIGPSLDGEYNIQNFRISPATQEPGSYLAENYIYLDMDIEGIDSAHASSKARAFRKDITAILSVLLDIGFYEAGYEHRWVLLPDKKNGRFQLGFYSEEPRPKSMSPKNSEKQGKFSEDLMTWRDSTEEQKTLLLPKSYRKLFKAYQNLLPDEKSAFLSASRMYQISLTAGRISKTVRATYQLAALDALSKPYREKNFNKKAIVNLVNKYNSKAEGEKIGNLYDSIRSAHIHQGYFDEFELSGVDIRPFLGPKWIENEVDHFIRTNVVFFTLNKWLYEKISKEVQ